MLAAASATRVPRAPLALRTLSLWKGDSSPTARPSAHRSSRRRRTSRRFSGVCRSAWCALRASSFPFRWSFTGLPGSDSASAGHVQEERMAESRGAPRRTLVGTLVSKISKLGLGSAPTFTFACRTSITPPARRGLGTGRKRPVCFFTTAASPREWKARLQGPLVRALGKKSPGPHSATRRAKNRSPR